MNPTLEKRYSYLKNIHTCLIKISDRELGMKIVCPSKSITCSLRNETNKLQRFICYEIFCFALNKMNGFVTQEFILMSCLYGIAVF